MKSLWKMLRDSRRSRRSQSLQGKPVFENLEPRLLLNAVPYIQDFSLGKPNAAAGWDYYSDNEGRIEVVNGRLRMDDTTGNSIYSSNEAILHVNLTGKTGVTMTLDHWNLADENEALPASFADRHKGDGIVLSVDGQNWIKVTDLTVDFTNQTFDLDPALDQAKIAANSADLSDVQIKFQQYDNYPANTDGREFDNIKIHATTVVVQPVPYSQDFALGKPDAAAGWEYFSDNEGRIDVVGGRLRMDDITGNSTYSSNEAILHVNLTNKTGVTLTLDHWSFADEAHDLPPSFFGRHNGDGIALSVDGQNWIKVTDLTVNFTNQTFNLDTIIQQAKIAANSTDLSNVRIKFQQYDNYPVNTDGREFDNIIINYSVNKAPVITSATASPSTISDTQTSQLQVVAYDPDSGPNPLTYSWSVPTGAGSLDNPNIVNPIYTPPDVSSTQTFTLTVNVSDGLATTSQTVDITVTDTGSGPQTLLSEDFNDGDYNGWVLVEQGTQGGPMAWSAATGVMIQSSNVHEPQANGISKRGTYAYWQAGSSWTDYTAKLTMKSTDNDGIGVMFRYQDENNYYRFVWDKERNSRALVKCKNGQFTILAEDFVPYVIGKSYQVKITVQGSLLQLSIDGSPVFSVNDGTFSYGTIALYSWGNAGSHFDDILVTT
jgi:hypothetical protein